jgi:hypothetical protein
LWENVNYSKWFTIDCEFKETEGTWEECCKLVNVNYANVREEFYSTKLQGVLFTISPTTGH